MNEGKIQNRIYEEEEEAVNRNQLRLLSNMRSPCIHASLITARTKSMYMNGATGPVAAGREGEGNVNALGSRVEKNVN